MFKPSLEEFHKLIHKVSDPEYHRPNDADQAFLNVYYRFRYFGLPYKYNFNLIMVSLSLLMPYQRRYTNTVKYQFHRPHWDELWDEAVLVHFTVRKPKADPAEHCHKGCNEWEPMEVSLNVSGSWEKCIAHDMIVVCNTFQGDACLLRLGERDPTICLI